jgi:hypothetical protein
VAPFGRYAGKTLPEIIVRDLDWFFWVVPELYGKLADEAENLARKARAIKIPNPRRKHLEVEYRYEMDHRFCGFAFVESQQGPIFPMGNTASLPASICLGLCAERSMTSERAAS